MLEDHKVVGNLMGFRTIEKMSVERRNDVDDENREMEVHKGSRVLLLEKKRKERRNLVRGFRVLNKGEGGFMLYYYIIFFTSTQ